MRDLLRRLSLLAAVLVLGACGASAAEVTNQVPDSVITDAEPAQAEPVGGSLSDFLSAEPALPTDAGPADEAETSPPTASTDDATTDGDTTTQEVVATDASVEDGDGTDPGSTEDDAAADPPGDDADDDGTDAGGADAAGTDAASEDVRVESSEAITVEPSTVAAAGEHTLDVLGTGFAPGVDVLVVTCVLPGDPLLRNADEEIVAERLAQLDIVQHCEVDGGAEASADDQGGFAVELSGTIETNSMLLAADLESGLGAYVLVPIAG